MNRIPAAQAAALFEQIIGWPYESPGVTDDRGSALGIDCSGAWVRVCQRFGNFIEHGSNSQYRRFCGDTGRIGGEAGLRVGMAVFKCKEWAEDQRGHRDYGNPPGNLYHVGCVTSVSPLRIVHATPPRAKVDAALGSWTHWGWLKCVEAGKEAGKEAEPEPMKAVGAEQAQGSVSRNTAVVRTESGGLRLRKRPDLAAPVVKQMPAGTVVELLDSRPDWARVRYVDGRGMPHVGWCAARYLALPEKPEEQREGEPT